MKTFLGIIAYFGNLYRSIRNRLELIIIVPIIELAMRLWYHLNPQVYSQRLRVRSISKGNAEKKSDRYVLFLLASKPPLPGFTTSALDAVAKTDLNLVIVFNGKLGEDQRAELLTYAHILIERVNLGRDFGGYRDGIIYLLENVKNIERLIIANDSIYYLPERADRLFTELNGNADFIGLTEVLEHHYHVQSFILSLSRRALQDPYVKKYWYRYRPISTRRWAIHKGEVGLTRALTKAGFKPHILYHSAQLIPHLENEPFKGLIDTLKLMPTHFRNQISEFYISIQNETDFDPLLTLRNTSRAVRDLNTGMKIDIDLNDARTSVADSILRLNAKAETIERWKIDRFQAMIVSTIAKRNQIHVGGFLFIKYLGLPVMKRDIFYREVFGLEDIYNFLVLMNEPLRDEIAADLRQKGTAENLKGLKKILYRHGMI